MAFIFITKGKTNWKYLVIVFILGVIIGSGSLWFSARQEPSYQPPGIKKSETADWKTYRNEEYKYEVKYPENWYFLKDACCPPPPTGITFNDYSDEKSELSKHQLEEGVFTFDILCVYEGKLDEIGEVKLLKEEGVEYEYLTVNGAEAIKFVKTRIPNQPEEKVISYYVVKGNSGCRIVFSSKCIICNQMLSTFRFLD